MATVGEARQVFERVARRYDAANRVISAGLNGVWRRRLAAGCAARRPARVLDVACGTGGVVFDLRRFLDGAAKTVGIDVTGEMLELARCKAQRKKIPADWLMADGVRLPFRDRVFDVVTISYGLRNLPAIAPFLTEARRVLRQGGALWILEFSRPHPQWFQALYYFYFTKMMPWIGGLVTGRLESYYYLAETVLKFPDQDALKKEMEKNGFIDVKYRNNFFGVTAIHTGKVLK